MAAMRASLPIPENWPRAVLAGVEAALTPWLLTVAGAFVTYVATASAPGTGNVTWGSAVTTATRAWTLAFGGSIAVSEGVISLAPLGLTLLAVVLLAGAVRRRDAAQPAAVGIAAVTYTTTVAVIAVLSGVGSGRHVLGGVAVALVGGLAALRGTALPAPVLRRLGDAADPIRAGLAGAGRALALSMLVGTGLVAVSVAVSWDQVREIHDSLRPDAASAVVLVLAQLLYLPTLAMWALAWLAGPGFTVGVGTSYTSLGATTEVLPAIPVLGALPLARAPWALVTLVLLGAVVGTWRIRRSRGWRDVALTVGVFGAVVMLGFLVLGWLASGSIGPERMSVVGVEAPVVAGALTGLLLAGFAVATTVRTPRARAGLVAAVSAVRAGLVGEPEAESAPQGDVAATPATAPTGVTAPTGATIPTAATVPTAPSFASALTGATAPTAPSAASAAVSSDRPTRPER